MLHVAPWQHFLKYSEFLTHFKLLLCKEEPIALDHTILLQLHFWYQMHTQLLEEILELDATLKQ